MSTLLLVLRGPMQSWGSSSRFASRATELQPTKSGVLGLIAAALGRRRDAPLEEFDGARFGVRTDQPGKVERDFQTARVSANVSAPLSARFYLSDAVFVAALEHEDGQRLARWQEAIRAPAFPLSLGRRAFPPAGPIETRVVEESLEEALASHPWSASERIRSSPNAPARLAVQLEPLAATPDSSSVRDQPVSFDPRHRQHALRLVRDDWVRRPGANDDGGAAADQIVHDPILLVEGAS